MERFSVFCKLITVLFFFIGLDAACQDSIVVLQKEYFLIPNSSNVNEQYVIRSRVITEEESIAMLTDEFNHVFTPTELMNYYGIDEKLMNTVAESFLHFCEPVYLSLLSWNLSQINYMRNQIKNHSVVVKFLRNQLNPIYDRGYGLHQTRRYQYVVRLNGVTYTSRKHNLSNSNPYTDDAGRIYYSEKADSLFSNLFHRPVSHPKRGIDMFKLILNEMMKEHYDSLKELDKESYSGDLARLSSEFEVTWLRHWQYPIEISSGYDTVYHYWNCIGLVNKEMPRQVSFRYYAEGSGGHLLGIDSVINNYTFVSHQIAEIPFIKEFLANDTSARITIMVYNGSTINKGLMDEINGDAIHWKLQDDYIRVLSEYELSEQNKLLSYEVNCGCNYRFDVDFLSQSIFFRVDSEQNTSAYCLLLSDGTVLVTHISYRYEKNSPAMLFNRPLHFYGSNLDTMLYCVRLNSQGDVLSVRNSTD